MKIVTTFALMSMLSLASFGQNGQTATEDMKEAGKATKHAAKKTGHKIKKGTKHAANSTADAAEKGAEKVKNATK